MTALEQRISEIVKKDTVLRQSEDFVSKVDVFPIKDKEKGSDEQPKKLGDLFIYAFNIPGELRHICYRYKNDTFILSAAAVKLSRNILLHLEDAGIPMARETKWEIAKKLDTIVNNSKYIYSAKGAGIIEFVTDDDQKLVGIALKEFFPQEKLSPYMFLGSEHIGTRGDSDKYYTEISKWITNKPKLQAFLALSAVGVVSQLLGEYENKTIFIVCGKTSKGKSTASLLPASVWCNPVYCLNSGGDTDRALQMKMSELNFIPLVVDEFVKYRGSSGKKLSNEMFAFNRGGDKATAYKLTTERNTAPFITSSEISVTKQIFNANTESEGELARFIEIQLTDGENELTKDADDAEKMTSLLKRNYGWLGQDIARHIIEQGYIIDNEDYINDDFIKSFETLRNQLWENYKTLVEGKKLKPLERRLMHQVALFIKSAELIKAAAPQLEIDVDALKKTLFDSVKAQCNFGENTAKDIMLEIGNFYKNHHEGFIDGEDNEKKSKFNESTNKGLFLKEKNRIWLTQETAIELFDKDMETNLKTLKNSGALVVIDSKHLSVQRMINSKRIRFYEVDITSYEGVFGLAPKKE
jgi:predicted nucleic acid-binding protein